MVILQLFFASINSHAQIVVPKPVSTSIVMRKDSIKINPSKFDKQAISDYKDQKEFQYDEVQGQQISWWDRFWMWFWNNLGRLFVGAASNSVSKYFFIAAGVAFVIFVVVKLIGAENIFSKKAKETILHYDILNENIHEIDYEKELQKLVSERKYRLAVRLLYLQALKKLSDADIIQWQPDKTNYNYLTEISKPELKTDFGKLTTQFDYIWYGDFPVDEDKFTPINRSFNQFNQQIK